MTVLTHQYPDAAVLDLAALVGEIYDGPVIQAVDGSVFSIVPRNLEMINDGKPTNRPDPASVPPPWPCPPLPRTRVRRPRPPNLEGRGENEMVLIHGLGSNADIWDECLPFLKGTFKVWTFEMAGHGHTQPIPDPTIDKEAERLAAFLKEEESSTPPWWATAWAA